MEAFDRLDDARVQPAALLRTETLVRHFVRQRVLERVLGIGPRARLVQEFSALEAGECALQLAVRHVGERANHRDGHVFADDGGDLEQALVRRGEPLDARQEHLLDRVRYSDEREGAAALPDRPRQFLQEERIALGLGDDQLAEGVRDVVRAQDPTKDARAILGRERLQRDLRRIGLLGPGRAVTVPVR